MARSRNDGPWALLGLLLLACGTVDPGPNFQFAEVVFDQNFFYCKVEPMMLEKKCAGGEQTDAQGCHASVTGFRFTDHAPTDCGNGSVPVGLVSGESQNNWGAASFEMRTDPAQAPLLLRPTNKQPHPREIFPEKSPQADLIRQWATRYSSR